MLRNVACCFIGLGLLVCGHVLPGQAHAGWDDWAEGTKGKNDGATRDFYNRGASLAWKNKLGDWIDANGKAQGSQPFAKTSSPRDNKVKALRWDITGLVRLWIQGKRPNHGVYLKVPSSGPILFYSREHPKASERPKLLVELSSGKTLTLNAEADTELNSSTYTALGNATSLRVGRALLRFGLGQIKPNTPIQKATLQLTTYKQYGGNSTPVEVFATQAGSGAKLPAPTRGIAAKYNDDSGLSNDADVLLYEGFEKGNWKNNWSFVHHNFDLVSSDAKNGFVPLQGKALRIEIGKNQFYGLSMAYKFKAKEGKEPEEIYFRYYLRLGSNWNQSVQGGKMPGISGTYGRAGWGGRKSNGSNGWSARGSFSLTIPKGNNPLGGMTPLGYYVYHADMPSTYGEVWVWNRGPGGYLAPNKWICVDEHVKMNTPGKKDGVLRAWVDGRLVFERRDLKFRTTASLKIEQIWLNVYHGGKTASPYDQHMYIDNVAIGLRYIGPSNADFRPPPREDTPAPREPGGKEPGPGKEPIQPPRERVADGGVPEQGVLPEPKREPASAPDARQADSPTQDPPVGKEPSGSRDVAGGDGGAPVPTPERGSQADNPPKATPGCGCHGGATESPYLIGLWILLLWWGRRRG